MKILLVAINAKYIHSNLAVYSLKSYAEKFSEHFAKNSQNEIELAEYTINQYSDWIVQNIYEKKPDVIAFSCYIWNIAMVEEITKDLVKVLPDKEIWLGGPEVSYCANEFLESHPYIKGIIVGEGEEIFKNLIDSYSLNTDFSNIDGLVYKNENIIINTKPQAPIEMSDIPFVYEHLSGFENRIIYYESSRGCPFSCSYCISSIDKHLRFRNIEFVKKELKFFIDHKTAQVKFVDRTFNCKKEHAMEIWKFIKKNDNGITNFHFEIAADIITDEEIEIISKMRPGLIQLEIGVQTTNPNTIDAIHRKMDFNKVAQVVNKLKQGENVHLHLDLIAGLPYENMESFKNSFNMVYNLYPEQLQLGFLKILHGSKMKEDVGENGMTYSDRPPYEVLYTKWICYEDILKLKRIEEVVEIYYNSGQFANSIKEIEKYFDSPFDLYLKLGEYYKQCSEKGEKHSRVTRYKLLLSFFKKEIEVESEIESDERKTQIFRQLLTLDFYLRENAKSRPDFCMDISQYKREITDIYIEEEKERNFLCDYEQYDSKQMAKMTHLEVFDTNVFDYLRTGIDNMSETFVLFNYRKRNPLNNDADRIVVK